MKKPSRLLTLLAAISLMFSLASCGTNNPPETSSTPSKTPPPATSTPATTSESPTDPSTDPREIKLPLVDTLTSLSGWQVFIGGLYGLTSPNEVRAYQELEKLTNVHVEWATATFMDATTNFNLSIASGDWPDFYLTHNASLYVGGYDKFIGDGIIIDLTSIVEENAPNYTFWRTQSDIVERLTTTESGNMAFMQNISKVREPTWNGFLARQDWLDASGSGIKASDVTTYDEFHDMLLALKENATVAPMVIASASGIVEKFTVGHNIVSDFSNIDGVATFGPITDGWKTYLKMMREWYQEGLIDPNFTTNTDSNSINAQLYNGDFGVAGQSYTNVDLNDRNSSAGANWIPVTAPVINKGDSRYLIYDDIPHTPLGGSNMTVTTACEYPELVVKWMDFGYTEEGALIGSYGIENESYEFVNGKPQVLESIYGSDNFGGEFAKFRLGPMHPHLYAWEALYLPNFSEKSNNAGYMWDKNYEEKYTMPAISVDDSVAGAYSAIINDVNTYVMESTPKFILGSLDIDKDWDVYVTTIKNLGIDEAVSYMQDSLDIFFTK